MDAYIDIQTTGLIPSCSRIIVVGIYLIKGKIERFVQLTGNDLTADGITHLLDGVTTIYTYNGTGFALPFIHQQLGVDLAAMYDHCDLMLSSRDNNLFGGMTSVEEQLRIKRRLLYLDGVDACRLWDRFVSDYSENAVNWILGYNEEDVLNLKTLRKRLTEFSR